VLTKSGRCHPNPESFRDMLRKVLVVYVTRSLCDWEEPHACTVNHISLHPKQIYLGNREDP
jgi:hypothetical protein